MTPVTAFDPDRRDNADLIADAARLGYIGRRVLDLSHGRGMFWTRTRPETLVTSDVVPGRGEFTHNVLDPIPKSWIAAHETAVWDPPYRLSGQRDRGDFDDRFGTDKPLTLNEVRGLVEAGTRTAALAVHEKGCVLVKVQDQVAGGMKRWQTRWVEEAADPVGFRVADMLHLAGAPGQQPARRQVHARSNFSTLVVLVRKGRRL